MNIKALAGAVVAGVIATTSASAAVVSPTVADFKVGSIFAPGPLAGRDVIANALTNADGTPDGEFLSLGFGGVIVLDFGALLSGDINFTEVTFSCTVLGDVCSNHNESVDVLVSTSFGGDANDLTGFSQLANVGNADARTGATVAANNFRYVALRDTSLIGGGSFDAFDLDVISVSEVAPIPVPAAGWLFMSALAGLGLLGRRRA